MGWFDGWNWGLVAAGATILSSVVGANNASKANKAAAQTAADTAAKNSQLYKEAGDKATKLITPILDQGNAIAAPGIQYLKTVTARNPYTMNPQQQNELAARNLATKRSIPLSFRGAGRTSTAMIKDTVNNAKAGMVGQNLAEATGAAKTLTDQGLSSVRTAAPALANIATGQASNIAAENTSAGQAQANAGTATAESNNSAMAAIASYFANQAKENTKASQYETYKAGQA